MAELTAQINVRMNKEEKERGDAALASIGYTASEAIRALWAQAASGPQGLARTKRLLSTPEDEADVQKRMEAVERSAHLFDEAWAQLEEMVGHPIERVVDDMSDEEYYEMLREQHYREKGLL